MSDMTYIAIGVIGLIIALYGAIKKKKFLSEIGMCIIWFGVLCGSYKHPMFGQGIQNGMSQQLLVSLLIPFLFLSMHVTKVFILYFYAKKTGEKK